MSDSASFDLILCDDSPNRTKKNKTLKSEKTNPKKDSPKKNKENKTSNKQSPKIKNKTKLCNTDEDGFVKQPVMELQRIKLSSCFQNEEQNSNKASPSSTVNDENIFDKQANAIFSGKALHCEDKSKTEEKEDPKEVVTFNPKSSTLNSNNESIIKEESEDEKLFSCQLSCTNGASVKRLQILSPTQLASFPNLTDVSQERSVGKENVVEVTNVPADNSPVKEESKHASEMSVCDIDSNQQNNGENILNINNMVTKSVSSIESVNLSKKSKQTSNCSQQNTTLTFDKMDNGDDILINICNSLKKNVENIKTRLDQGREMPLKISKEPDGVPTFVDNVSKAQPILQNTTNLDKPVTENSLFNNKNEDPKDSIREFSVLSYIPKTSDLQTSKTTLSVNDSRSDNLETHPQLIIKSEKVNKELSENLPKVITHKLSVKKEFNCKREFTSSPNFNSFHQQEPALNLTQDCFSNILSNDQPCDKDTYSKQISKNDRNACLLHNFLEEDECLKNCSNEECLLIKPTSTTIISSEDSQNCNVKNLFHSSISPYKSNHDWNKSSTTIKKEVEFESKHLNTIFNENKTSHLSPGGSNSNEERYVRNDLHSIPLASCVLVDMSEHLNTDCDYESEDSNLVIDEDVDMFKEHIDNVLEDQSLVAKGIADTFYPKSTISSKSNLQESTPTNELSNNNGYITNNSRASKSVDDKNKGKTISSVDKNGTQNKPSTLTTSLIKVNFQDSDSYNHDAKRNLLPSKDTIPQTSCLQSEIPHLNVKKFINEQTFSSTEVKKRSDLNGHQIKLIPNIKISKSTTGKILCLPVSHPNSSTLVLGSNSSFVSKLTNDSNYNQSQQNQFQKLDRFTCTEAPLNVNKTLATRTLNEPYQAGNYMQYNSESISVSNKKDIPGPHVNPVVNKFKNLNKTPEPHKKDIIIGPKSETPSLRHELPSLNPGVQSGSVNYLSKNVRDSRSYSNQYKPLEGCTVNPCDGFNKSEVTLDPLCMGVKPVVESREPNDFEFNIFPVAHEEEVCSGTDAVFDFVYPGSSEIGHPDWPIANEQSVIDSSTLVSYSSAPDQYLYTSTMTSDQCYTLNEMNQNCSLSTLELQQVLVDFRYPDNDSSYPNKDEFNVHFKTLEADYNLCCSQRKFKEFYLSQDVPPTIPVPYPPQGRLDNVKSVRCTCEQCSENHQKLLSNYNILTQFRNSKVKPLNIYSKSTDSSLSDLNCESDCSLPLKKRKTLTNSKSTEEPKLTSYPNTPMISIAQLELTSFEQQNQMISNKQSHWNDVPSYTSTAHNPLNLAHYPSVPQVDLSRQTKHGKSRSSKRRKSSR